MTFDAMRGAYGGEWAHLAELAFLFANSSR